MINNVLTQCVSFYRSIADTAPLQVQLHELLLGDKFCGSVEAIRKEPDPAKQKQMKKELPLFTPSALCEGGRSKENIKSHTGLICLDFDEKDNAGNPHFHRFKEIIKNCPYVAYCGLSCRGNGYFVIIPIANPHTHREHYAAAVAVFAQYGFKADESCSDQARARFVSYDPEPYTNPAAEYFAQWIWQDEEEEGNDKPAREKEGSRRSAGIAPGEISAKKFYDVCKVILEGEEIVNATPDEEKSDPAKWPIVKKAADDDKMWVKVGLAFCTEFGESGRDLFHRFSALSGKYDQGETDEKYDYLLKTNRGEESLGTFYYLCRENRRGVSAEEAFRDLEF